MPGVSDEANACRGLLYAGETLPLLPFEQWVDRDARSTQNLQRESRKQSSLGPLVRKDPSRNSIEIGSCVRMPQADVGKQKSCVRPSRPLDAIDNVNAHGEHNVGVRSQGFNEFIVAGFRSFKKDIQRQRS